MAATISWSSPATLGWAHTARDTGCQLRSCVSKLACAAECTAGGQVLSARIGMLPCQAVNQDTCHARPPTHTHMGACCARCQRVMSIDASNNLAAVRDTPAWPTPGFCGAFSAMGSSTMLMLDPANGYKAELVNGADNPRAHKTGSAPARPLSCMPGGFGKVCAPAADVRWAPLVPLLPATGHVWWHGRLRSMLLRPAGQR